MVKNYNKTLLAISLLFVPIYVSLIFSILNFKINGYYFENYFLKIPYRDYYANDYYLLVASLIFIILSTLSLIFFLFFTIKILKIKFYKIQNYEILTKDIYFRIILFLILINKTFILFSQCNVINKYSQIFYLIGSFDYIIFYIVFGIVNKLKLKNNFITYFFILFNLLILLQVFLGSIYDLASYMLIIIFFLLLEENNKIKKIIIYSTFLFIIFFISFLIRDYLRSTSIIKSDKFICSKEKYLASYNYAISSLDNFNCDNISVGSYCKKYLSDKKFIYKESNKVDNFNNIDLSSFNLDKFSNNFLSRYDFLRELNNYNIFFHENNSFYLLGDTYKNLFFKFVPRFIFPNKPTEKFGGSLPKKYGLMRYESSHSRPINFFAESFVNFSYYGFIISPLIFTLFLFPYLFIIKFFRNYNFVLVPILFCIFNFQNNLSLAVGHIYYLLFLIISFLYLCKYKKLK